MEPMQAGHTCVASIFHVKRHWNTRCVRVLPILTLTKRCFESVEYFCTCKTPLLVRNMHWELPKTVIPKDFELVILRLETLNSKGFKKTINVGLALTVRKRKTAAEIKYGNIKWCTSDRHPGAMNGLQVWVIYRRYYAGERAQGTSIQKAVPGHTVDNHRFNPLLEFINIQPVQPILQRNEKYC